MLPLRAGVPGSAMLTYRRHLIWTDCIIFVGKRDIDATLDNFHIICDWEIYRTCDEALFVYIFMNSFYVRHIIANLDFDPGLQSC